MADWAECLSDPRPLRAVFGAHTPGLTGVTLHEVSLDVSSAWVLLRLDLADFPADPPVKWREFDTVQVSLRLLDLTEVRIEGLPTHERVDGALGRDGDAISATVRSAGLTAAVRCRWVDLARISAYRRG